MAEKKPSKYWLDVAAAEIANHYPDGEIVISSGISPSASYHIGHFREILTADALTWALRNNLKRQVKHVHVVDNFDPLRKRYSFLPESYEAYVGQPICLIPDPFDNCRDKHRTYAEHFYQEFEQHALEMGIKPDVVVRSYEDLYKSGRMTERIEQALDRNDLVRKVFEQISNRKLPEDWTPVQVMNEKQIFHNAHLGTWDKANKTIGEASYVDGHAKLNWRLDWPARWAELGVMVEPFSAQEHGAAGGSYDTGVEFANKVFDIAPPIPGVRYGNIHMLGDTKKMSSSKGNLMTPEQTLDILPAEVLRYFVVRSTPDRTLYFDSGLGIINLIDEFSAVQGDAEHEFRDAFNFAVSGKVAMVISSVPYRQLVDAYQATNGSYKAVLEALERSGAKFVNDNDRAMVEFELKYVKNWIDNYAPESVKFTLQTEFHEVELSAEQRKFLGELAGRLEDVKEPDGQQVHELIYAAKEAADIKPGAAFQALYRILLAKDSGPKAGWFLASLDQEQLLARLNHFAKGV